MYTTKEINKWLKKHNYSWGYLTENQLKDFINSHVMLNEIEYDGDVCKFTGMIHQLVDIQNGKHVGHLSVYKSSNGMKLFNLHLNKEGV